MSIDLELVENFFRCRSIGNVNAVHKATLQVRHMHVLPAAEPPAAALEASSGSSGSSGPPPAAPADAPDPPPSLRDTVDLRKSGTTHRFRHDDGKRSLAHDRGDVDLICQVSVLWKRLDSVEHQLAMTTGAHRITVRAAVAGVAERMTVRSAMDRRRLGVQSSESKCSNVGICGGVGDFVIKCRLKVLRRTILLVVCNRDIAGL